MLQPSWLTTIYSEEINNNVHVHVKKSEHKKEGAQHKMESAH